MLISAMAYIYDFCRHDICPYRHARAILMCKPISLLMAIWEYPFRHALATFLA